LSSVRVLPCRIGSNGILRAQEPFAAVLILLSHFPPNLVMNLNLKMIAIDEPFLGSNFESDNASLILSSFVESMSVDARETNVWQLISASLIFFRSSAQSSATTISHAVREKAPLNIWHAALAWYNKIVL
jgi:hypothetical protein